MADESVDIRYLLNSEEFARESARIDAAIRGTEQTTSAATAKMESDFQHLGKVVGKIGIATALAAAGREAFRFARDFESHMREVTTISDEVSTHLDGYKEKIIDLSATVPVAATESASALYQIVSAGHDGADGMTVLETAARAAVAGVTETATAADGITSILNAYQKGASEAGSVSDMMFTTVRLGKTTFGELAASIAQVTPTAAAYGVEMDQVLAAIATLTKSGVPTAQAVTRIRQAIVATSKVLGDGAFDDRSLQEALTEVAAMAEGSESKLRTLVPEIEAVNGVLGLTGINAETAAAHLDEMSRAVGATQKAFDRQMEDANKQIELLKNNLQATFYGMGDAALDAVGGLAEVLNEAFATGAMDKMIATVGTLVVAYGTYRTQLLLTAAAKRAMENARYDEEARQLASLLTKEQQRALGITNLTRLTKEQAIAVREKIAAEARALQTSARLAAAEKTAATEAMRAALQRSIASKELVRQRQEELAQAKLAGDAARVEAVEAALAAAQEERHAAAIARKTAANNLSASRTKAAAAATAVNTLQTRLAEATDRAAARSKNLLTVATTRLARSFKALKAAFMSNPLGAIITLVTTAATAMSLFGDDTEKATENTLGLARANKKSSEEIDTEISKLQALQDVVNNANNSYEERRKALNRLKEIVPSYHAELTSEGQLINNNTESLQKYLKEFEKSIRLKAAQEELEEAYRQKRLQEKERSKAQNELKLAESRIPQNVSQMGYGEAGVISTRASFNEVDRAKQKVQDAELEIAKVDKAIQELNNEITRRSNIVEANDNATKQVETVAARVAALRKAIAAGEKELKKMRSGESTATEAEITKASEDLKKLREELATYTGVTEKEGVSAAKRVQEVGQTVRQAELDTQAQRIAAMRDGKNKRLAEIDLEYQQTLAKIDKSKAEAKQKGATGDQLTGFDRQASEAFRKMVYAKTEVNRQYAEETQETYRELSEVFLTEEERKTRAVEEEANKRRKKAFDDVRAGNISGREFVEINVKIDRAEEKEKFDLEVERYRRYTEERMRIEEQFNEDVARLRKERPGGGAENEIEQRKSIRDSELKTLTEELGITQEGFVSFVDSLVYYGTESLISIIHEAQIELDKLGKEGDPAKRAAQQKRLNAAQKELERRNKKGGQTNAPTSKELKTWAELQRVLNDVYDSFGEIGEAIGGTAGEAIELGGEIATAMTQLIGSILQVADSGATAVQSTSEATSTAIKGVESASVILAVISAALQVATKIAQLFTKDHELSEETIKTYEAYMDVTDKLIDRQKDLLEVVTGVQAVMASKEGIETIEKQIEATRQLGKAYLDSRKRNNRSYGYKMKKELVNYSEDIKAAGFDWDALKGRGDIEMEGLFDLSASELKRFQKELPLVWAKIDEDARKYLETIIECDEKMNELGEATSKSLTGFSFDDAKDELLDFLNEMDMTFDDVAENFQTTMMHAINHVVASGLNDKLKKWYEKMSTYLEDGKLSNTELDDLQKEYEEIYRDAVQKRDTAYAAAGLVPGMGTDGGLSGEIRENITEETATRLEGLFRVTYDKVAELRQLAGEQLQSLRNGFADVKLILEREILIEENTRRTADNTDGLRDRLEQLLTALSDLNRGGGVYAK
ncbi:phage tail tape measure protein [uncultured Rikenella sp.]|uniref:phage tail tape measure protein n=1 Tax=uncultured Rikenella sp. TaxID=368003 RepID=UPI002612383B|nr:phage tail tape measure protein [uncultured Rikenella sp.]